MRKHSRSGYGLFQLFVVLAILLILLGLLLPAVQKVREAAARMQSQNNMKQIGLAAHNYLAAYNHFPTGVDDKNFSALMQMLPFIEQDNLYKTIDKTKNAESDDNAAPRGAFIKTFLDPRDTDERPDQKAGPTNYAMVAGSKADLDGNDGIFYRDSKTGIAGITDGTSNTLMTI